MPDPVFYFIAYALPFLLSATVGGVLVWRAIRVARTVPAVVSLLSWSVLSAFNCLLGAFVGRLYTFARANDPPPDPTLPLRPGLIILAFLVVQGAIGAILYWAVGRKAGGATRK